MNRQEELYTNLMSLVDTNEAFYYVDHAMNNCVYRVFTYRLASYTDFLLPDALECRGHMFRLDLDGNFEALVSYGLEKFFNYMENPMTMDMDMEYVNFIHEKRDGSLITSYLHEDMVCLKSKTALASDQALGAMNYLRNPDNDKLADVVDAFVREDHTVIFEYTSPTNRIVLPYQFDELKVLAVRQNHDGAYVDYGLLYQIIPDLMVKNHTYDFDTDDMIAVIADIYDMGKIEGFVIGLSSGQRFKVKTTQYASLHRAKDSIQSDKRLFEVALNDGTDDLRTMFHDDQFTLNRITKMESIVGKAYNHLVASVEKYHNDNYHLIQKDYAIKAQKELDRVGFHLSMQLFNGKLPDYKGMILRNFEEYME